MKLWAGVCVMFMASLMLAEATKKGRSSSTSVRRLDQTPRTRPGRRKIAVTSRGDPPLGNNQPIIHPGFQNFPNNPSPPPSIPAAPSSSSSSPSPSPPHTPPPQNPNNNSIPPNNNNNPVTPPPQPGPPFGINNGALPLGLPFQNFPPGPTKRKHQTTGSSQVRRLGKSLAKGSLATSHANQPEEPALGSGQERAVDAETILRLIRSPPAYVGSKTNAKLNEESIIDQGPQIFTLNSVSREASQRFRVFSEVACRVRLQTLDAPGDSAIVYVNDALEVETPIPGIQRVFPSPESFEPVDPDEDNVLAAAGSSRFSSAEFIINHTSPLSVIRIFTRFLGFGSHQASLQVDTIKPCKFVEEGVYLISNTFLWDNASKACASTGGHLLPVRNNKTAKAATKVLEECLKEGIKQAWIDSVKGDRRNGRPLSLLGTGHHKGILLSDSHSKTLPVLCEA